jgi:hypothetical protein
MSVSIDRARDFVYQNGVLWERALFAQLFEGVNRERVLRCLALHQNEDGGWGHALEHDVRTPASNAPSVEFALGCIQEFGLADPTMLARTAAWCEAHQAETGTFSVGAEFHAYPRAEWWQGVGEWPPLAIVGRLAALGAATERLLRRTARWVEQSQAGAPQEWPAGGPTMAELAGLNRENWRYRLYQYGDYFMNVAAPDAEHWRATIVAKTIELAREQPDAECALGWGWAAKLPTDAIPTELIEKRLAGLATSQQEDGGWPDPHGLPQWRPLNTIWALKTLREFGRL